MSILKLPLLEHPISEYFEMPDGPGAEEAALLQWISDRVEGVGASMWYRTSFVGREDVWIETLLPNASPTGVDTDLLIRSYVNPPGRRR